MRLFSLIFLEKTKDEEKQHFSKMSDLLLFSFLDGYHFENFQ